MKARGIAGTVREVLAHNGIKAGKIYSENRKAGFRRVKAFNKSVKNIGAVKAELKTVFGDKLIAVENVKTVHTYGEKSKVNWSFTVKVKN